MTFQEVLVFQVYNNPVSSYLKFTIALVIALIIAQIIKKFIKHKAMIWAKKTKTNLDDVLLKFIYKKISYLIVIVAVYLGKEFFKLTVEGQLLIDKIIFVLVVFFVTYLFSGLFNEIVDEVIEPIVKKSRSKLDDQLLPIIRTSGRTLIWILSALIIITNLGPDFSSLVAGLGIGGLAVALAAQQTLGNFFASIAIFTDQPFQINDMVKFEGHYGKIKKVGLRSTRLVTTNGTEVVIPNSKVADSLIENVTKRPTIRVNTTIGLVYSTPLNKMEEGMEIIKKIIKKEKDVKDASYVHFAEFADSSLNIEISYWVNLQDEWMEILAVKNRINLSIKREFEKHKLEFAFPTRHVYMRK